MAKTKAVIEKELKELKEKNEKVEKRLQATKRTLKDSQSAHQNCHDNLSLYQKRYGRNPPKTSKHVIEIRGCTLYRDSFKDAQETVKKLVDAGVWYFSVGEK